MKLFTFSVASFALLYYFIRRRQQKLAQLSSIPVVSVWSIFSTKDDSVKFDQLQQKLGSIFIIDFFFFQFVAVSDSSLVRSILKNDANFPKKLYPLPNAMKDFHDNNIVVNNGEDFERHRSVMKSSFEPSSLASYLPIFEDISSDMSEALENLDLSHEIDMSPWVIKATMDMLGKTILGFEFDSIHGNNREYVEAYTDYLGHLSNPIWMLFPFLEYMPFPFSRRMVASSNKMKELLNNILKERIERKKRGEKTCNTCMLDYAIDSAYNSQDNTLSEKELKANTFIFMIAGHETTASAVTWGLHLLAKHPEIQERVYEELNSVLKGRCATPEDLENLPYFKRVMNEILRMQPPVFQIPTRGTSVDTPIEGTDYVVPANSIITIMVNILHKNPEAWPNPEKFDPDRFKPEEFKNRSPYDFIPFSIGKRACIGVQFSRNEQLVLYSTLLQKFRFKEGSVPVLKKRGILNTPVSAFMKLEKRESRKEK